jgi:hypothetical protein
MTHASDDAIEISESLINIAEAIKACNEITLEDGSSGSVMIGISQALFQIGGALERMSYDYARYVDHVTFGDDA